MLLSGVSSSGKTVLSRSLGIFRLLRMKTLILILLVAMGVSILLMTSFLSCDAPKQEKVDPKASVDADDFVGDGHRLAVIVPFRDRFDELTIFLPYMSRFLNQQKVKHKFYIINQNDNLRFNRAALLNIGYLKSHHECDYLVLHDVDLLPLNHNLSYLYPIHSPFHISAPELHPRYHYETFVGGILLLTVSQYEHVNGMTNNFWGWGREDDEFYHRMKEAGYQVYRPEGISTGPTDSFLHIHDKVRRKRDQKRIYNQKEMQFKRDRLTGIDTVQFHDGSSHQLSIDGAKAQVFNVQLTCDRALTPYCVPT